MKIRLFFGAAALAVATATGPAIAQDGDPDAGKKVFRQCQACHMVGDNAKPRVGPPLNDIFGRQAGTYEGFRYSPAMKGAGENGLVWNVETFPLISKIRAVHQGQPDGLSGASQGRCYERHRLSQAV